MGKPFLHEVATEKKIARMASGGLFNIVVSNDKKSIYSWGVNDEGQLGRDGEETTPEVVKKGEMKKGDEVEMLAAGDCHAVVVTASGKVYCWGTYRDSRGILGYNYRMRQQDMPTEIKFPKGTKVVRVSCGENHTLVMTSDHEVYGWGCAEQGQLVFHMKESMRKRALTPHPIAFYEGRKKVRVENMWAGGMHSLFVLENGHV